MRARPDGFAIRRAGAAPAPSGSVTAGAVTAGAVTAGAVTHPGRAARKPLGPAFGALLVLALLVLALLVLALWACAGEARGQTTDPGPGGETATGFVFEDLNGNGLREADEPGVPGVAVSNGLEVVQSGPDGGYRLPVAEGAILFVTKPSGYAVPLDDDNLPRFYYIHDPDGTPAELDLRYRGIDPTGPLPDSVDFALLRSDEPDDFKVVWLADPQPQTPAELDYLRDDVVAELIGTEAAFGITVGDVMYDDLSLYPRYNRLIAAIGIPWYNVPGNHDLNFLSPDDRHSLETFKRVYGPATYSFDYGRVHFVVLDDVLYHGRNVGRKEPNAWGMGTYEGGIDQAQLDWLAKDLRLVPADKLVVITLHIPLRSPGGTDPVSNVANRAALLELLSGRRHVFAATAHLQNVVHQYLGSGDGFEGPGPLHQHALAAASGGWWSGPLDARGIPLALQGDGTPNGYYVMSVRGNRFSLRYKAAGKPADYQMRISVDPVFEHPSMGPAAPQAFRDPPIPRARIAAMEVVVNLFDGGPKSRVEYRIGDRAPVPMTRSRRIDPLFARLSLRTADRSVMWTRPQPSEHIWAAPLPRDLEPGIHRLSVRALDEYGQTHRAERLIEIEG